MSEAGNRHQPRKHGMNDPTAADLDAEIGFLRELVRMPSDNPPGDCGPHAERAADLIEALGFSVERHRVPADLVARHGMVSVTNLVVRRSFGRAGPVVALNAHGDVVPPGEGWTCDPYGGEIRNGAMFGRGVAVSKSDFATYVFALKALEADPAGLNGTVELHLTYDEEAGGFLGPKWLLDEGLTHPDLAISAGFSYAVVTAHNGCLHLEATIRGRQAHAAMPETGVDALEAATGVLAALYEERRRLAARTSGIAGIGSPKLTVGLISGGINTNVVPDRVRLRIDRRLIPEEDGEAVERDLVGLIDATAARHPGASAECRRIMLAEPLRPLPGSARLVEAIRGPAARILGIEINPTGVPLYTDARHYADAGIPTVLYGAGPRSIIEANAHAADEHLRLSDLAAATNVVAAALRTLLSG